MVHARKRVILGVALGVTLALGVRAGGKERAIQGRNSSNNPVPLINQPLSPSAALPGGAGFTLTVNGDGFVSGSVVNWNGSARTTTFVSSQKVTASILASDIAAIGTASVTVVNPAPGGGPSNVCFFDITASEASVTLNRTDMSVGNDPAFIAEGDFNRDGKLDLAVTNDLDNTVSVLLGNGDGTFKTPTTDSVGVDPLGIVVADFNNDGKPDLAVVNDNCGAPPCQPGSVSILLGNGDGTFGAHTDFTVGTGPVHLAAGDFNGDGNIDLAVTNEIDDTVSILLGNGNGTFATAVAYQCALGPISVGVGDFNQDGKLDLAVTGLVDSRVSILLGNGDGTFQSPEYLPTGPEPFGLVVGDFNNDGKLDIAVTDIGANTVGVLTGLGNAQFFGPVEFSVSGGPFGLTAGDFNGDGKLDLMVASHFNNQASLLLGNGDGTFQTAVTYATGSNPVSSAAGDFNGDGRLDLATADESAASISVLLQPLQAPQVSLVPSSLTFANQAVGTTSPAQSVTLTNTGNAPLTFTGAGISITGTNSGDFAQTNTCGSSVAAGANCAIMVTFTPTATGSRSASLSVSDNAPGSPQTVALSGTGITNGPSVTLSPTSLTYPDQGLGIPSPPQTVTLTNSGSSALTITSILINGTDSGDFSQTNTCPISPSTLAANANCAISVVFTPKLKNTRTASVSITDNAPGSPQTAPLTGTGTEITLTPPSINFGNQPAGTTSNPVAVTVTNVSHNSSVSISSITIMGGNISSFAETNNCPISPSTLAVGATCTINVTFTPQTRGLKSGTVNVNDTGGGSPQMASLSGTGT